MRKAFSEGHEYVLIYGRKVIETLGGFQKLPILEEQRKRYKNPDNDPRGEWVSSDFTAQGFRPNQMYEITTPGGAVYSPPEGTCWKNVEEAFLEQVREGRFWFGKDGKGIPRRKNYLSENDGRVPWTWWVNKEVGHTQEAKQEVNNIFQKVEVFSTPKPVRLINRMLQIAADKDAICLDFFAGSGVTAHAVLEQNKADNGNRKFILVQLPEQTPEKSEARSAGYPKISDITIERVKRVIEGYGDEPQPLETGFKVYQLTKSHFPRVEFQPDHDKTEAENIEAVKRYIAEKEEQLTGLFEPSDIQDEVLLKNGFRLNYTLADVPEFPDNTVRLADDGHKQSLLCLDTMLKSSTVDYLVKNPQPFICLEVALTTTDKWNLRQHLKHQFVAF